MTRTKTTLSLMAALGLMLAAMCLTAGAGILVHGVPNPDFDGSSMQLWLRGDRGVSPGTTFTWDDQSNHGHNASQGTGSKQPSQSGDINSHATVDFDGGNSLTGSLTDALVSDSFTGFMVLESDNLSSYHSFDSTSSSNRFCWASYSRGTGKYFISFAWSVHGTITGTNDPTLFSTVGTTNVSTNTVTQWINGNSNVMGTYGGSTKSTSSYRVGSRYDGTATFLNGRIAEVIVYDRALDAVELNAVGDYLRNKYNISASFEPTNYIDHVGRTDPETESPVWTLNQGLNTSSGAGTETIGGETFDYWHTTDSGTGSGEYVRYEFTPTLDQLTNPWKLSARMRLISASGLDQTLRLDDGTDRWDLWFLTDRVMNTTQSSGAVDLAMLDTTDTYHLYELVYTPVTIGVKSAGDTLQYYIDGVFAGSIDRSDALGTTGRRLLFGSVSSPGTGEARWNFVEFKLVPEPSTLLLLVLGASALLLRRRRRPTA